MLNLKYNTVISKCLFWILSAVFTAAVVYMWRFVLYPYPIEFREGHSMSSTTLLLNGRLPYTLDSYPEYYNSYGILYSLVVFPFALLFGNNIVVYRIINELFYLGAILTLTFYRRSYKQICWIDAAIGLVLYLFLHVNTNVSIRPDGLGVFLYTLSLTVPYRREFDRRGLLASALCGILAFYTKPYYILGWYASSIACLFKDWKASIVWNIYFHIAFAASCVLVTLFFPLYFYETVFAYGSSVGDLAYSISGMLRTFKILSPIILCCFISVILLLVNKKWAGVFQVCLPAFFILVLLIYPLGTNDGSYLTYQAQLLAPIAALSAYSSISNTSDKVVFQVAFISLLCFSYYKTPVVKYPHNQRQNWTKVMSYLEKADSAILNTEPVAALLLSNNMDVVNDGVSGFVYSFTPRPLTQRLFGLDSALLERKTNYITSIRDNVRQGRYDYIIACRDEDGRYNVSYIDEEKYRPVEEVSLVLPCQWPITLVFFAPYHQPYHGD